MRARIVSDKLNSIYPDRNEWIMSSHIRLLIGEVPMERSGGISCQASSGLVQPLLILRKLLQQGEKNRSGAFLYKTNSHFAAASEQHVRKFEAIRCSSLVVMPACIHVIRCVMPILSSYTVLDKMPFDCCKALP